MVAYSFKKQFIAPILEGTKRQTIRADRKRHAHAGERVQLYTGQRTKYCVQLGTALCSSVEPIRMFVRIRRIELPRRVLVKEWLADAFARADGFASWEELQRFWQENHPDVDVFSGWIIRWTGFEPTSPLGTFYFAGDRDLPLMKEKR